MNGSVDIDLYLARMTHPSPFSPDFSQGFGFNAPTNEAIWALATQNAMDGKSILLGEGSFFPFFQS